MATTMHNFLNGFLVAVLLCSVMINANAANPSKEVDGGLTLGVVSYLKNDSRSPIVPWGMANSELRKGATRNSTRNTTSLFKLTKRKNTFGLTAFEEPAIDRLSSYQPYFQDGKTVTNPHKVHRWRLICW